MGGVPGSGLSPLTRKPETLSPKPQGLNSLPCMFRLVTNRETLSYSAEIRELRSSIILSDYYGCCQLALLKTEFWMCEKRVLGVYRNVNYKDHTGVSVQRYLGSLYDIRRRNSSSAGPACGRFSAGGSAGRVVLALASRV